MTIEELKQISEIKKHAETVVKKVLSTTGFTVKKVTDTPVDSLSVVNRGYVTMNGTSANRPTSSVVGQMYFDTSLATNGKPVWWNGTGFVDATGTYV